MNRCLFRPTSRYITLLFSLFATASTCAIELEQKDVLVYGQNIHYAEIGTGPPLILLHGLWGGLNEWEPVIAALSESRRVIVMDFIGFHGSGKPDTQYHNALLSQYVAGFIDALAIKNVTLMGHAMGANSATYTAVHYPDNIGALVLIDGAGYRNPDRDLSQPLSEGQRRFRKVATGSTLAATRGLLERRVADQSIITDAWVEQAFSLWVDSARAIGDLLFEGGDLTEDEMRRIRLPTLVVWGAEDSVFPVENAQRLAADIEGAEIRIIEGAGHLPQIEQTGAFLNAVRPFLESQRADQ